MKVLVLGGGVMGCACALELARRGHKVSLWEKRSLGGGASGAGTGLLMQRDAQTFHSLFREFYVRSVREYYPSWVEYLKNFLPELHIQKEGFWLGYTQAEKERQFLDQCEREGSLLFEKCSQVPDFLKKILNTELGLYHFPEESYISNPMLLKALEKALIGNGVAIQTGVEIKLWDGQKALSNLGNWEGDATLVCAGVWSAKLLEPLGYRVPLVPVKGQALQLNTLLWEKGVLQINDHFYGVPREGKTLLGATSEANEWAEDFNEKGREFLGSYSKTYFGQNFTNLHATWAGLRPRTKDRKPFMGWLEEGKLALCFGHYKNGLSMAPLAAECMANLMEEKELLFNLEEFAPWRKKGIVKAQRF